MGYRWSNLIASGVFLAAAVVFARYRRPITEYFYKQRIRMFGPGSARLGRPDPDGAWLRFFPWLLVAIAVYGGIAGFFP